MLNNNSSSNSSSNATSISFAPVNYYQVTFRAIMFAAILIGNLAVLVAIGLTKQRRSRMKFFIFNLAIADLCVGPVIVLTDIIRLVTVHWYAGDVMCRFVRFLQAVVMYASTFVLVALSLDRFYAIALPMKFTNSGRRAKVLIFLAWSMAAVFSLPMLILNRVKVLRNGLIDCRLDLGEERNWQIYMILIAFVIFVIPTLIIAACSAVIVCIIWSKSRLRPRQQSRDEPNRLRHLQQQPPPQQQQKTALVRLTTARRNNAAHAVTSLIGSHSPRHVTAQDSTDNGSIATSSSGGVIPQAKIRTVKMTCVIVLAFILCWTPYFAYDLLDVYRLVPRYIRETALPTFIQSLSTLNSVVNPVIYGVFSSKICQKPRRNRLFNHNLTNLTANTYESTTRSPGRLWSDSTSGGSVRRYRDDSVKRSSTSRQHNDVRIVHDHDSTADADVFCSTGTCQSAMATDCNTPLFAMAKTSYSS